jgi:hypothetical protein
VLGEPDPGREARVGDLDVGVAVGALGGLLTDLVEV